mgnify:FL=1
MQRIKNLKIKLLMSLSILGVIFGGCDSLIYDNLEDCPQGVYVKFYSMTPCETDSTFIGNVSNLSVFAFDDKDKLVVTHNQHNVSLSRDFEVLMPVSNGNYNFVTWAGVNDNFSVENFTPGTTTKQDVMMTLKMNDSKAVQLGDHKVWQGESRTIHLPDPAISGALYKYTAVNLREVTNRIKLIVEFDRTTMKEKLPKDLRVKVSSANSIMHIDGTTKRNAQQVEYPAQDVVITDDVGEWNYSLLDLVTGMNNNLKITLEEEGDDSGEEKLVFDGDLIASILLRAVDKGVSLDCENDFEVKFLIKDYCVECWTHFSCNIYVNNWLVHSYSTDLEI